MILQFRTFFRILTLTSFAVIPVSFAGQNSNLRGIHSYQCSFNFLTGSGVTDDTIACLDGMYLGLLSANYEFYLHSDAENGENNFTQHGGTHFYSQRICGLDIARYSCAPVNSAPDFYVAVTPSQKMPVALSFTAAPSTGAAHYGYAAAVNEMGECPEGMVHLKISQAVPASYTSSGSNFINIDGSKNDMKVSTRNFLENFLVMHTENSSPCAGGICPVPNGNRRIVQSVDYQLLAPTLCVIPGISR